MPRATTLELEVRGGDTAVLNLSEDDFAKVRDFLKADGLKCINYMDDEHTWQIVHVETGPTERGASVADSSGVIA